MVLRCQCLHCVDPLVVGPAWRFPLQRETCMLGLYGFPRTALRCGHDHRGLVPVPSGCATPAAGFVPWHSHQQDIEGFLARHGLDVAYRAGGMTKVLREIGLLRMQAEAFVLHFGMGFTQE